MSLPLPSDPSPELRIALDCIDSISKGDIQRLSDCMADDLEHHLVPPTIDIKWEKSKVLQFIKGSAGVDGAPGSVSGLKMEVLDYVEMPGKVWLYIQGTATATKTGEPYNNRYFFTFEFAKVEGQLRIVRSREMFDSYLAIKTGLLGS